MSELYPLLFDDILKDKIWGGRKMDCILGRGLPADKPIGESWEISDHGDDTSVIANGPLAGTTLHEAMERLGTPLLGTLVRERMTRGVFPLLVKFLDASNRLSVQVHPDDAYAAAHEGPEELGKTECWYIIHAEPGAKLITGVAEGMTPEGFRQGIETGTLEKYMQQIKVKAGDFLYIPSGRLHAIMEGIVLCEIQQNSDTTYRVYDWNRMGFDGKPRQLHIDRSLDTIDFTYTADPITPGITLPAGRNRSTAYAACPYFYVQKLDLSEPLELQLDGRQFKCLCDISGSVVLEYGGGTETLPAGRSCLLPADLGTCRIVPGNKAELILSYVPDLDRDVREPLKAAGVPAAETENIIHP